MSKVLVIEDQDDIRSIICEILTAENFNVIDAEDGHIGVLLAQEEMPDLVICDIMMPEFDGYSVMTQLRQNPYLQSVPFIFLTAKASKTDLRLGMELGANDYLTKPFTRDELLRAVNAQIETLSIHNSDDRPTWSDHCCDLIQSLPLEIHQPLEHILNLAQSSQENEAPKNTTPAKDLLNEIKSTGDLLYERLQNIFIYQELASIEQNPQRLRIFRKNTGICATKAVITNIARTQAQYYSRISDLQLELKDATILLAQPKLQKIIEEIVDNAFKYSAVGTPVSLKSSVHGQTFFCQITNEGQGPSPEQLTKLGSHMQFDHPSYLHKCVGLGLIIAKLIAELHGGELQVKCELSQHTKVSVFLPLA